MGFSILALKDGNYLKGTRIGGYGSERCLVGLFLAAYGVSGYSDSKRVRKAWVTEYPSSPVNLSHPKTYHVGYPENATVDGLKKLIATNTDNVCWMETNNERIDRGLMLKPPKDKKLEALVKMYQATCNAANRGDINPLDVQEIAPVLRSLLPNLKSSTAWFNTLTEVSEIFNLAATNNAIIRVG